MCLAIPVKILKIENNMALVDGGCSGERRVNISLIKDAAVGDYVLVHADMAINKLDKKEAKKIIKIINNSNCCHEHEK